MVQDPSHCSGERLPSASEAFATRYGEKAGDYFFAPLRKYIFTEQGIKRWYAPRLVARPHDGTGFAAINLGDAVATYEGVSIPPQRAVLVAHPFETMAIRVQVTSPGTYFVAAAFSPAGFEGPYSVAITANGMRLWQSTVAAADEQPRHGLFVKVTAPGFIDFANNADKAGQTFPCRTFVQYAVVRCDEATGALELRCDDRASDLGVQEIVDLHAQTGFDCTELCGPQVDLEKRAAIFEQEWTLSKDYISSQYQCSVRELVELVMNNRSPAATKYCIFMMPRSGSTLLAELLARSGKMGFPGELFVPDIVRTFSLAFSDVFSCYEELLTSGVRTPNGVFGVEIEFVRFAEEPSFFAQLDTWRHVYIWREDLLAQAISLRIANETWVWHAFEDSAHDNTVPFISRAAIIAEVNFLLRGEQVFRRLFAERAIAPYTLSYEQLVSNPEAHARAIAEHIGLPPHELNFARIGNAKLRPTAKARNAYYKQMVMCGEGEFWGYDIHERGDQFLAVLHGVDLALIDVVADRSPIVFVSASRDELHAKVHRHVLEQIASLPPTSQESLQQEPRSLGKRLMNSVAKRIGYKSEECCARTNG